MTSQTIRSQIFVANVDLFWQNFLNFLIFVRKKIQNKKNDSHNF